MLPSPEHSERDHLPLLVLHRPEAPAFGRPNPDLDWQKPLELSAEGEHRRVIAAVLTMANGVTAEQGGP